MDKITNLEEQDYIPPPNWWEHLEFPKHNPILTVRPVWIITTHQEVGYCLICEKEIVNVDEHLEHHWALYRSQFKIMI